MRPATKAALQRELLRLARETEPGDIAVFYFSGHGYRVRSGGKDERDGWDEALVCEDLLLLDDWFRDTFWPNSHAGTRWVTCVDACFSQTVTYGVTGTPDPKRVRFPAQVFSDRWRIGLAACGESERALELPPEGRYVARGLMTDVMLQALEETPDASYTELWQAVGTYTVSVGGLGVGPPPDLYYSAPGSAATPCLRRFPQGPEARGLSECDRGAGVVFDGDVSDAGGHCAASAASASTARRTARTSLPQPSAGRAGSDRRGRT
ncbi:caspase family protein [Cryptosporangium sp. NPDC051539]|uniref:caspase family protein n=1 Tax=Cryptosporangium sp. NPDC051539 TaxID=3363962 RepID=UPI0037AABA60